MIKIADGYEIDESLITAFEEKFNVKLPKDYKEFMLKNNGGEPEEDFLFDFFDNVIEKNNTSLIRSFFRIYENKNETTNIYDDLEKICQIMWREESICKRTLPIADDPGGNVICISLNEDEYGTIYFANHEYEDCDTGYLYMSKIAANFTEFINNMYIED